MSPHARSGGMEGLQEAHARTGPRLRRVGTDLATLLFVHSPTSIQEGADRVPLSRPRILIVGRASHADQLAGRVEQLGFIAVRLDAPADVARNLSARTVACLYVPPFPGNAASEAVSLLRDRGIDVPAFVIMHSRANQPERQILLEAGCDAQLAWPGEERVLITALVRLFLSDRRARSVVIEERVRARLDGTFKSEHAHLDVRLRDDVLEFRGHVEDAWQVEAVRRISLDVPGVSRVDLNSIERAPAVPSDNTSLPVE